MSTVRDLHNQAMKASDRYLMARHIGETGEAIQFALQAMQLEREAAERLEKRPQTEPTRSILYRSAASLAFDAEEFSEASRLTFEGLAGFPPPDVYAELIELFERIKFAQQFGFRDSVFEAASIELSLVGNEVGYGLVPVDLLREKITALVDLVRRSSDRLTGATFRTSGPQLKSNPFQAFVRAARPGSFRFVVEVGYKRNENLSFLISNEDIAADVVNSIRLVHDEDWAGLAVLISDPQYFDSCRNSVRSLAPDGDRVSQVALNYKNESIVYSRTKRQHDFPEAERLASLSVSPKKEEEVREQRVSYIGELKHFDERDSEDYVMSIVTEHHGTVSFNYSISMIDTIRAVLGEPVEVLLLERGNRRRLISIDPAP